MISDFLLCVNETQVTNSFFCYIYFLKLIFMFMKQVDKLYAAFNVYYRKQI